MSQLIFNSASEIPVKLLVYTGQLKKNETLSHAYNEVTSEPTITRYTTIVS
jgi:hypothetical protein